MRTPPIAPLWYGYPKVRGLIESPSSLILIVIGCRQRRHIRTMTVSSWLPGSQVGRHRNRPAQVTTADPPGSPPPGPGQARRLCPRENASGAAQGKTTISGRGRPGLRLAAWRAVWAAMRTTR
jgi:hypothetical protein